MSLRILLLYDCLYPRSVGGVEHRNYELARALAARGHRVTLAGFAEAPSEPFPGVEILPVGPPGRLYTSSGKRSTGEAARLARAVLRLDLGRYDVIETANIPYAHLPPLAFRCRRAGKPLVVTWYEYWGRYWRQYLGAKWPVYAAIERMTAQLGTAAISSSRLTAERVGRVRGETVPVVRIGIPLETIRQAVSEGSEGGDGPPLVYAGRLLKEKRIDLLLEAVARLKSRPILSICGDGPDRGRLEEIAARLGLNVLFHGHLPTNVDVWRKIGESKIAVQPSSREGYGMFPLEAMAAGLPVVYCESSESALSELVEDGVHGLRTAPDPDALAAGLDRLLKNEGERRWLADNARRHAEGFDWGAVAVATEAVFLQAVALIPAR
ncbi:MAG TPA: glycosyltransferase family 4 protein [Thermoanaerobaculia bacterium]|nr:glycosyltransferase family 4 protein [Thermoanaerobaculia bacterium]